MKSFFTPILLILICTLICEFIVPNPARSLNFKLIFDPTMSGEHEEAFIQAANIWERLYSDRMTVYIDVGWRLFHDPHILAAAGSAMISLDWRIALWAMRMDERTYREEADIISLLPSDSIPIRDSLGERNAEYITMTTANAKALGLSLGLDPRYGDIDTDAIIIFNLDNMTRYDFDRSDGIDPNKADFITVAAHEIGHVLGFISLTDDQDDAEDRLNPYPLDLWRFPETGGPHDITNEYRLVTAGEAEYYDSVLNNRPLSCGVNMICEYCEIPTRRCQASHWRDDLGNLMDPTTSKGEIVNPTHDDIHALDLIGYNRPEPLPVRFYPVIPLEVFKLPQSPLSFPILFPVDPECLSCLPAIIDYPGPPDLERIYPPFQGANLAMVLGMNIEVKGLEERKCAGFAIVKSAMKNENPILIKTPYIKGSWEKLGYSDKPMEIIPARITEFYFESERQRGPWFSFRALIPVDGAFFNPNLGPFGGFRISGVVDGEMDNQLNDGDGILTLLLLLTEPVNNVNAQNLIGTGLTIDPNVQDNGLRIMDYSAFGLPEPDFDNDGIPDSVDNCPATSNQGQEDTDNDGLGDICDNCPCVPNPDQLDSENDGAGDACMDVIITLDLPEGWSMVSLPVLPKSTFVSDLFPGAVVVYGYEGKLGYVRISEGEKLKVGKGYWILLDESASYTFIGQPIQVYTQKVSQNQWDMIGGCTSPANVSINNGNIVVIYGFKPYMGYVIIKEPQSLIPGKGYWILFSNVTDQGRLSVTGGNN